MLSSTAVCNSARRADVACAPAADLAAALQPEIVFIALTVLRTGLKCLHCCASRYVSASKQPSINTVKQAYTQYNTSLQGHQFVII